MFVLRIYLTEKNPVGEWASESALWKPFIGTQATIIHIFSVALSLSETIIISYFQFTFGLDFICADLNPLNDFTKVVLDY